MTEPTNGGVRITNREIYDMVVDLKDELRASKSELKADIKELKTEVHNEDEDVTELQSRVRSLELKFYGILAGLVGAVAILLKAGKII